jgi:hypothetical protein
MRKPLAESHESQPEGTPSSSLVLDPPQPVGSIFSSFPTSSAEPFQYRIAHGKQSTSGEKTTGAKFQANEEAVDLRSGTGFDEKNGRNPQD